MRRGTFGGLSAAEPTPDSPPPTAFGGPGGAAVFRGTNYQTAVATYIAAVGLAAQPHQLGDPFPHEAPTRIAAEQHWPIDDVAVWFGEPIAWIQAKRNAGLDDLHDAFIQFVGQLKHGRGRAETFEPLGPHDRFIFAYEHAPAWAADAIELLKRLRDGSESIDEITQGSTPARDAYDKLAAAARAADATLDTDALHTLLRRVYFFPMTMTALTTATRSALHFVVHPGNVPQAEDVLYRHLDDVAARRSLRTIDALRTVLRDAGCALLVPPSVRGDVDVLLAETARNIAVATNTSSIAAADGDVHLDRAVTAALVTALTAGNVIVTAPAGEGKSVALRDAAIQLRATGKPVAFLHADGEQPHLTHTLAQIFERWGEPGYLFIDGFDSLRLGRAANPLRDLIGRLRDTGWHVAIASREYDLAHDAALRRLFPLGPPIDPAYRDNDRFRNVAVMHLNALSADEIVELRRRSAALDRLFSTAPDALAKLLTNPFNLSIAATLAADVDLGSVRDRGELLSLWWDHRVAIDGSANEAALRTILRAMITRRRLDVPTGDLDAHATARDTLLSNGVLVHRGETGELVAFRHAAIFDYAVERLLLRGSGAPAALLGDDPDAFVFILPSVRSHFEALFDRSPTAFFAELRTLLADSKGRAALSLVLAQIPALQLRDARDLAPLLDGDPTHAKIFHHIVSAALYWAERGVPFTGPDARPWADVALLAGQHLPDYAHDAALLVDEGSKENPTPDQGHVLAHAARLLVIGHLARATTDPRLSWFAPIALPGFIRTIDYDPAPAMPLLQRLVAPERIAQVGQFELFPLTTSLDRLHDPNALELLFCGIFADVTLPEGTLPIGRPNVAINLVHDSKQILDVVRGMLARRFAAFLDAAPREAIRAMCTVVGATRPGHHTRPFDVGLGGVTHRFLADVSNEWETRPYHDQDDWKIVAQAFGRYLQAALDAGDAAAFAIAFDEITAHGPDLLLWRILIRNAGRTAESARTLLPLLTQRAVLVQPELQEPFCDYLAAGYALLTQDERAVLDDAILAVARDETNERLRGYREDLLSTYADAIPTDHSPTLEPHRHTTPPSTAERELTLRGFTGGRPADFALPNATAPTAAPSPELAAALADAAPFFPGGSDDDAAGIVPLIRRIEAIIEAADAPLPDALRALLALVKAGLRHGILTDDDLRAWTPLMLATTTFDHSVDAEDAGPTTNQVAEWNALSAAASTLPWVFQRTRDPAIAEAVLGLADHPDPYIQDAVLQHVLLFSPEYRARGWELAERAVNDESAMLAQCAGSVFDRLVEHDAARAWQGRLAVYDRFAREIHTDVTVGEIRRLIDWALAGHPDAVARLDGVLKDPWANPELSKLFAFVLTTRLGPPTTSAIAVVPYIVSLIERLRDQLQAASAVQGNDPATSSEGKRSRTNTSATLLVEIADRVDIHSGLGSDSPRFDDPTSRLAHYKAILPVLEALARVPLPHAAYHVVKSISSVIDLDPAGVLALGIRATLTGAQAGLAMDQFAQADVRDFLLTYLNEHRALLEENRMLLNGFMDVVDAFAAVGWPAWVDVTFALDAIYRDR